ncbi:MAG: hypothetical protein JXA78_06085 [Anaerolineales bacterium]|nr:hypothetical protein [Anaerolineales bacterium]
MMEAPSPIEQHPSHAPGAQERRWVLLFALILMSFTTLPYLLGYSAQGDAYRFSGFVFGVEDGNSYIAKMLGGVYGAWLFRTPYTAYPQQGALLFLPYLLLGKLAWPPGLHEQLVALYHLFRFGAGMLVILATYDFLAYFLADVRLRCFGLALAALGGGLGWILVLAGEKNWLGSLPLEFYSPESFGFLGLYGLPHLALARALMLWALLEYLKEARERQPPRRNLPVSLSLGALWLSAGLAQPLSWLLIGALIGFHLACLAAWQGFRERRGHSTEWPAWRRLARLAVFAGILPCLFVLINAWQVLSDPFVAAWTAQNIIRSPHPAHYLLAYGLLLPYAWLGGKRLLQDDPWGGWLAAGWVILLPALAYAPVDLQRRLPEGVWTAWVVLAMAALDRRSTAQAGALARRWIAPALPLLLAFPSTLFLLFGGLLAAGRPGLPIFRPAQEVEVFEYLGANAQPGEVVLSSFETGNPLPAWAPVRVVIGHGPESANLAELLPRVSAFYSPATLDAQRIELLQQFDVRYVIWGPAERALGAWDPSAAAYLAPLYTSGDYTVLRVVAAP